MTKRYRSSQALTALMVLATGAVAWFPERATAQVTGEKAPSLMTPKAVADGTARMTGHYEPSRMLRLAFALKPPHPDEERQLIDELHDKNSPNFHKFLTAEEWRARFAPLAEDEQALVDWAQSQGFTITQRYYHRLLVDVEAPAGRIEKALNIKINNYQLGSASFFSNDREPQLPSHLAGVVGTVLGLNSLEQERPVSKRRSVPARPD